MFHVSHGSNSIGDLMAKNKSMKTDKNFGLKARSAEQKVEASYSGADWSLLEADFFAREADLYLPGGTDSFDDLDNK